MMRAVTLLLSEIDYAILERLSSEKEIKNEQYLKSILHQAHRRKLDGPIAYIDLEKRRLEFATPIKWETHTIVKYKKIPLFYDIPAQPAKEETK